jgi:uncharacterized protein (DUF2249 family)/predicted HTH domain antitoxin
MKVTRNTKISRILRENKDAIDTIASINKHFKKLNNPVLRRVLAPRVTVTDAAKIGNITVNEFLKRLSEIGFEVIYDNEEIKNPIDQEVSFDPNKTKNIDVRATIKSGADPFSDIMSALKALKEDEVLKLINVFEPIPIINVLKEKGYKAWTTKIGAEEYHTFFKKEVSDSHQEIVEKMPFSKGSFEEKLVSYGANVREIDVRLLEMPEPMVTILKEVELLPEDYILLVNHKKVPQFLLPELKTRNYTWMHQEVDDSLTKLLIFKQ